MHNYETFYSGITKWFRRKPERILFLETANKLLTYLFYISYPLLLIRLIMLKGSFLRALFIPAVSFGMVSLARKKINRKRPYETWTIDPLIKKDTKGKSWPSRHVFSAAVIAMVFLYYSQVIGIILLILAALSGAVRVIGGVHYPTDVIGGYVIGVLAGCCMFL